MAAVYEDSRSGWRPPNARMERQMSFLPIVGRELRVAARKRGTFWLRVAAALTGLLFGSGCLFLAHVEGSSTARMGSALFNLLTWTCLVAGLTAGLFFTSDCVSEEKREGTLGLLFLTELRGYDVALGKLLAASLRTFYALLAILPIVAITQLMGGVSGAQYWKSSLALVNGVFVSLAAGLFISVLSRDSQKALALTLLLLLLLALGGPVADAVIAKAQHRGFRPLWSLSSPAYVLSSASAWSAWGRAAYWNSLALCQLLAWTFLALASALVPRAWQEKKRADACAAANWAYAWRFGGPGRHARLRRQFLATQPVAWLTRRERWQSLLLWTLALLTTGAFAVALTVPPETWIIWHYLGGLVILILYLGVASQASRFFVEARRSGLLELLLASPLTEKQIVAGQWRGWLPGFGLPLLLLLGVYVAGATLSQRSFQRLAGQVATTMPTGAATNQSVTVTYNYPNNSVTAGATVPGRTNTGPARPGTKPAPAPAPFRLGATQQIAMVVAAAATAALGTAGNVLALCWFGLWMGLTSKSANLATLKTILFVQVLPWFAIAFLSIIGALMVMGRFRPPNTAQPAAFLLWWPLLSAALGVALALAKDLAFILWSRNKLYSSLRLQAARIPGQPQFDAPPPLSPPAPTLPSLPAAS